MKSALLPYIGLLEVDKAAFRSLADVLGKNRYDKFFFSEIRFINIDIGRLEVAKAAFPSLADVLREKR